MADLFTLIHFQRCSRPSSRGRVQWHTALCPAAELHLVIKVTLEEDPETTHGSGGRMCQTGGLQSGKYLTWPLPASIGFQFISPLPHPRPALQTAPGSPVLHSFHPPDVCTEASWLRSLLSLSLSPSQLTPLNSLKLLHPDGPHPLFFSSLFPPYLSNVFFPADFIHWVMLDSHFNIQPH